MRHEAAPAVGEAVLDAGWNLGIGRAEDEAVGLQRLQRAREHLLADALDVAPEGSPALRAVREGEQHQDPPFAHDVIEDRACGAPVGEKSGVFGAHRRETDAHVST